MKKIVIIMLLIILALFDAGTKPEPAALPVTAQKPAVEAFTTETEEVSVIETIAEETPVIPPVASEEDDVLPEQSKTYMEDDDVIPEEKLKQSVEPAVTTKTEPPSKQAAPYTQNPNTPAEADTDIINTAISDEYNTNVIEPSDLGNNNLVPYAPRDDSGTPNPFANPQPNNINEIPAEDIIQPGDDKKLTQASVLAKASTSE